MNYFEVLSLKIEDIENQDEATISERVNDAYQKLYGTVNLGVNNPRFAGRSREEWHVLFLQAKDTLLDPAKRRAHIEDLRKAGPTSTPAPAPAPPRVIAKFSNGDEATSIPELALLMMAHFEEAKDALYRGFIETSLGGVGELHFANAARDVVQKYPNNQDVGLVVLVQILEGKISFRQGGDAKTPQQLASLIDQNWKDGKNLLYNGFIALWLKYVNEEKLADAADRITSRYAEEKDMGLEFFVQRLDPHIGLPDLKTNHTSIDFGKVDTETEKTIRLEIENAGRGFLHGDIELVSKMPGLQISSPSFKGRAVVTVKLDASHLTAKQRYGTRLIIKTNGGELTIPISCYVDYPKTQLHDMVWRFYAPEKIEVLLHHGVDVNVQDNEGNTPLHWAVKQRRLKIIRVLLHHGVDVNVQDNEGNTPLHWAVKRSCRETTKVLLRYGADITVRDKYDKTPLKLALMLFRKGNFYDPRIVELLLIRGGVRLFFNWITGNKRFLTRKIHKI